MSDFGFIDDFGIPLAPKPVTPKNNLIRSLDTLVALTQRFADDYNLDVIENVTDAEKLRLGYYPDKAAFEPFVTHSFHNRLPVTRGLVFPYTRENIVTMLVVNEMESVDALSPENRTYVYAEGRHFFNKEGLFGGHRLRGNGKREIVLTNDELLVCRTPNAIAVQELCEYSLQLLYKRTKHIVLCSTDRTWVTRMLKLSKLGFDISVDSEHVLEYVARQLIDLTKANLPTGRLVREAARYLRALTDVEQTAVIATVAKFTGVTIPTTVHAFEQNSHPNENAYLESVRALLFTAITTVQMDHNALHLTLKSGEVRKLLIQPSAVAAVICPLFDVREDLVQWSYNQLNGVPRSVAESNGSRWQQNLAIAEIVLSILTRYATE